MLTSFSLQCSWGLSGRTPEPNEEPMVRQAHQDWVAAALLVRTRPPEKFPNTVLGIGESLIQFPKERRSPEHQDTVAYLAQRKIRGIVRDQYVRARCKRCLHDRQVVGIPKPTEVRHRCIFVVDRAEHRATRSYELVDSLAGSPETASCLSSIASIAARSLSDPLGPLPHELCDDPATPEGSVIVQRGSRD